MIAELDISELNSPDETLADFLREQEIRLILPCGGNGTCGHLSFIAAREGKSLNVEAKRDRLRLRNR